MKYISNEHYSKIIQFVTITLISISHVNFAQGEFSDAATIEAEKIALLHSEYMIARDFDKAIKLILPNELKELEADILMILNEGKKYNVQFPFLSEPYFEKVKENTTYPAGSILKKYYENFYGLHKKDYHTKVIASLKVIESTYVSKNAIKVRYSFDAYGADEPVNLEYEKTTILHNSKWYVTKDLPVGRMVSKFKNMIETKKQDKAKSVE